MGLRNCNRNAAKAITSSGRNKKGARRRRFLKDIGQSLLQRLVARKNMVVQADAHGVVLVIELRGHALNRVEVDV